jgi:alpha-glucosidase
VMRFWFDRGVDGFRVDAVDQAIKDSEFRNNPPIRDWHARTSTERLLRVHQRDHPELHERVAAPMRRIADGTGDRVLISEAYLPPERIMSCYGSDRDGFPTLIR